MLASPKTIDHLAERLSNLEQALVATHLLLMDDLAPTYFKERVHRLSREWFDNATRIDEEHKGLS